MLASPGPRFAPAVGLLLLVMALRSAPLRSAFYAGALQIYREHLQQREQGYARQRAVLGSAFWQRRRDSAIETTETKP